MSDFNRDNALKSARFNRFSQEDRAFLEEFFKRHPKVEENLCRYQALPAKLRPKFAKTELWNTPRAGWVRRGIPTPETVDTHAVDLTFMIPGILTSSFAPEIYDEAFINHVAKMARLHDLCEAIATDFTPHDKISPEDKDRIERIALLVIFEDVSYQAGGALVKEYIDQETEASHILHDLDKLHAVMRAWQYEKQYPDKEGIYEEFRCYAEPKLKTDLGRAFMNQLEQGAEECLSEVLSRQENFQQAYVDRRLKGFETWREAMHGKHEEEASARRG